MLTSVSRSSIPDVLLWFHRALISCHSFFLLCCCHWFCTDLEIVKICKQTLFGDILEIIYPLNKLLECVYLLQNHCCGAQGPEDWDFNIYFDCKSESKSREKCGVPFSCCIPDPAVSCFLALFLPSDCQVITGSTSWIRCWRALRCPKWPKITLVQTNLFLCFCCTPFRVQMWQPVNWKCVVTRNSGHFGMVWIWRAGGWLFFIPSVLFP